jgi:GTPase SAR1 family protein
VYDITSVDSFYRAQDWVRELEQDNRPSVIAFVGNKCDLGNREVQVEVRDFLYNVYGF